MRLSLTCVPAGTVLRCAGRTVLEYSGASCEAWARRRRCRDPCPQVGVGIVFVLCALFVTVVVNPYVHASVLTEHVLYQPKRLRIVTKLKLLSKIYFDLQGAAAARRVGARCAIAALIPRRVSVPADPSTARKRVLDHLEWYKRWPEVLTTGWLANTSLAVVLLSLCLCLMTTEDSHGGSGHTEPIAQVHGRVRVGRARAWSRVPARCARHSSSP